MVCGSVRRRRVVLSQPYAWESPGPAQQRGPTRFGQRQDHDAVRGEVLDAGVLHEGGGREHPGQRAFGRADPDRGLDD